jgi:DHA2 family multidrug resistance protein
VSQQSTQPHVNPWIVAIAVMSATFLEVLDTTVVNVSLPHIGGSLSATVTEATWVLTSYCRSRVGWATTSAGNAC